MFIDLYNIIRSRIFEGWKDVYNQYVTTGKVPSKVFDEFKKSDPSSSNKYLQWMCKQYTVNPNRQRHIIDVVKLFDQQVERGMIKGEESDIYKYGLEEADELAQGKSGEKTGGEVKREQKSESTVVKETDDYLIVVPESHAASCFYGAHTQWCISGKSSKYWDQYYRVGVKIYIIIDKRKNRKYAVAVAPGGEMECFDEQDEQIKLSQIEKAIGAELSGITKPLSEEEYGQRVKPIIDKIIAKCTKNSDGSYSTDGNIDLSSLKFARLPVKFKYVGGNFNCGSNRLTTLEGAPQKVGGNFHCGGNRLTTLEGAPQRVGGGFYCYNNRLTSLEGGPQEVGVNFSCRNNRLTTLDGAPQEVGGYFYCLNNQLTSLEGAPQKVGGGFHCGGNQLTTLEGAPKRISGDFYCYENQLTTLEGAPQEVGGHFYCSSNQLTTLEGAPKEVGDGFHCDHNRLTSLKGAPQEVGGDFYCHNNKLTTLEGAPQEVGDEFRCGGNPVSGDKLKKTVNRPYLG